MHGHPQLAGDLACAVLMHLQTVERVLQSTRLQAVQEENPAGWSDLVGCVQHLAIKVQHLDLVCCAEGLAAKFATDPQHGTLAFCVFQLFKCTLHYGRC